MSDLSKLIDQQEGNSAELQKALVNYKKSPKDRKTESYLVTKGLEIGELWNEFQRVDNEIRRDPNVTEEYPYIKKDLFSSLGKQYNEVVSDINLSLRTIKAAKTDQAKTAQVDKTEQTVPVERASSTPVAVNQTSTSSTDDQISPSYGLVRKISARMSALQRLLDGLPSVEEVHPLQYYQLKISTIQQLWSQIDKLNDQIWEGFEDPKASGFDPIRYDQLDDLVQKHLVTLQIMSDKLQPCSTPASA